MTCKIIIIITTVFITFLISCSPAINRATVKINGIDSVIRTVNPNHNCGCNWGNKKYKLYTGGTFSKYNYFWLANYVKNTDSIDVLNDSQKIKNQLLKLEPEIKEINNFYLEYRLLETNQTDTTIKYKVLGTWFSFKNSCSGFIKDMNAKKLIKKIGSKSFKQNLCK